jgi:hypothetical protein
MNGRGGPLQIKVCDNNQDDNNQCDNNQGNNNNKQGNADPVTPLPAALPLFATGLGALGLLGLRRKRRAQTVA